MLPPSDSWKTIVDKVLWNGVYPQSGMPHLALGHQPHEAIDAVLFRLDVGIQPNRVTVGSHTFTTPRRHATVRCEKIILGDALKLCGDRIIISTIEGMARECAPHLYECDPRIGLVCDWDREFIEWPLFDPPGGLRGAALYQKSHCTLCDTSHGKRVWGGGNLGWVHLICLARVHDAGMDNAWTFDRGCETHYGTSTEWGRKGNALPRW